METLIVHPTPDMIEPLKQILQALKIDFEKSTEKSPYNPEFVEKIKRGDEAFERGDYKVIKTEDLWK